MHEFPFSFHYFNGIKMWKYTFLQKNVKIHIPAKMWKYTFLQKNVKIHILTKKCENTHSDKKYENILSYK